MIPAGNCDITNLRRRYHPVCLYTHTAQSCFAHQLTVRHCRHAHVPMPAVYSHTDRAPIRAYRPRMPIVHLGRVYRPVRSGAHTGRACAYRPRMPAAYTSRCAHSHIPAVSAVSDRVYRSVCPCTPTVRHAHGRIPKWYTRAFRPIRTRRVRHPTTSILLLTYNIYTRASPPGAAFLQEYALE